MEMLRRPLYKGTYEALACKVTRKSGKRVVTRRPAGERILVDGFPAIVDAEIWQAAQDVLDGNRHLAARVIAARNPGRKSSHIWAGLLRCTSCGGALSRHVSTFTVNGVKVPNAGYRCRRRAQRGKDGCPAPSSVPEIFLDEVAIPAIFDALSDAILGARKGRRRAKPAPKVDGLAVALADIVRRRENVQDMREEGRLDRDKYRQRMDRLDEEEAAARAKHASPVKAQALGPEDLRSLLDAWRRKVDDPAWRHRVLRALLAGGRVEPRKAGNALHLDFLPTDAPGWPDTVSLEIMHAKRHRARLK